MSKEPEFPPLAGLGQRICVCGPSNSGKSTLAHAIGIELNIPAIHLDLLRHLPNTDWVPRPNEDFVRMHNEAIAGECWVIDGNYSSLMPSRLERATGAIQLWDNRYSNFARYLRRTLFEPDRVGTLEGNQDSLKWDMVSWILVQQPKRDRPQNKMLHATNLPFVELRGMRQLNRLYDEWGLTR